MSLIPTHCGACGLFRLVDASSLDFGEATCPECGAQVRAVPGESYGERDQSLFDGFARALRSARIDANKAAQLLHELDERRSAGAKSRVARLGDLMPALGNLEVLVAELGFPGHKAEGVLLLFLRTIAARPCQARAPAAGSNSASESRGDGS